MTIPEAARRLTLSGRTLERWVCRARQGQLATLGEIAAGLAGEALFEALAIEDIRAAAATASRSGPAERRRQEIAPRS